MGSHDRGAGMDVDAVRDADNTALVANTRIARARARIAAADAVLQQNAGRCSEWRAGSSELLRTPAAWRRRASHRRRCDAAMLRQDNAREESDSV